MSGVDKNVKDMNMLVDVVYEDENIIVADKPRNMRVCDEDEDGGPSLIGVLSRQLSTRGAMLYPCHRLDAATSGLVLAAKSEAIQQAAFAEFRKTTDNAVKGILADEGIIKTYNCMAARCPHPTEGILRHYLLKDDRTGSVRALGSPARDARLAVTRYSVLRAEKPAIVEARLYTGRTHQIRVQLAQIRCPILGDDKYGDRTANRFYGIRKLQLFAVKMEFRTSGPLAYLNGLVVEAPPRWAKVKA